MTTNATCTRCNGTGSVLIDANAKRVEDRVTRCMRCDGTGSIALVVSDLQDTHDDDGIIGIESGHTDDAYAS